MEWVRPISGNREVNFNETSLLGISPILQMTDVLRISITPTTVLLSFSLLNIPNLQLWHNFPLVLVLVQ